MNEQEKIQRIKSFMTKTIPVVLSPDNSEDNIRYYLNVELDGFYDDAFIDGQEDVLKSK